MNYLWVTLASFRSLRYGEWSFCGMSRPDYGRTRYNPSGFRSFQLVFIPNWGLVPPNGQDHSP